MTPLDVTGAPAGDCPSFSDTFMAESGGGSFVVSAECTSRQGP